MSARQALGMRPDVGDDDVEFLAFRPLQRSLSRLEDTGHAIDSRVLVRRLHGLRVEVNRQYAARTQLRRGDPQDARAGAEVEHTHPRPDALLDRP